MRVHLGPAHFARQWAESAWLFRSITENLDRCVYVLDRDGRCLAVNDSFCRWLKRRRPEILGRFVADFWPHPTPQREADEHERVLHGEWIETEEERPRGGQTTRVRLRKAPLRDAEGNVQGILCLFREAPVEPANEASRWRAPRMEPLSHLTSGVFHDLHNLLTLVGIPLTLFQAGLPVALGEPELATLWSAVKHGTALAERLLGRAHGEPGGSAPVDVNEHCTEMVDLLHYSIAPRIRLEARLQPALPPVLVEAGEMIQVLLNLCLNAYDAMPHGGRLTLETELRSVRHGETRDSFAPRISDFVCLRVRDTGEGMSPEVRAGIFERMFTTKPPGRNSGLGLPIVLDIVQRRGGWIDCESVLGAGTSFTVWLPAASACPDPAIAPSSRSRVSKTILVIEPDPDILSMATTILMQRGFRVLPCQDGRQTVELYRQYQAEIDLVVIEDSLPGQSGLELMNDLLAINPRLAIVMVSAAGTPAASWPACTSALAFLIKPYTPEQLVQYVGDALSANTHEERLG